ncbi:fatty acyl-CoA reductase [Mycobacteroides abscessus subsp. abscessus]|nr:fatty acyl-CoA reductase [Mycobacteroides abscessus subsp. abscessus]
MATWGVLTDVVPQFAVYNASKAALSTVSRIVDAEYGKYNVHTTTLYFPYSASTIRLTVDSAAFDALYTAN